MSSYDELLTVLIKPEALATGFFITPDEVDKILDICTNYKVKHELVRMIPFNACFRFIF